MRRVRNRMEDTYGAFRTGGFARVMIVGIPVICVHML